MIRWISVGVAVLGLLLSFLTHHAGILALGLLLAFIGSFATFMSFVSERVAERSRPDTAMLSPEQLAALHKPRNASRAADGGTSSQVDEHI